MSTLIDNLVKNWIERLERIKDVTFEGTRYILAYKSSTSDINPLYLENRHTKHKYSMLHKKYALGEEEFTIYDATSWEDYKNKLKEEFNYTDILPVYMIDHSQLSFSLSPFGDSFDSGQVGYVFTQEGTLNKENIEDELLLYTDYANGDIYTLYEVDPETLDIESSYDFFYSEFCFTLRTYLPEEVYKFFIYE